jgi:hypothetical protein
MTESREALHTGGCQCGAVRYALYAEPHGPHICHCRMCQKAFGSFFAPLVMIELEDFAWTRGEASIFMSSPTVERGFCGRCGTPLTFRNIEGDRIDVSIGSLDAPAKVRPERQIGTESRMPWFAELQDLPASATEEYLTPERLAKIANRQHPDHDTDDWPS